MSDSCDPAGCGPPGSPVRRIIQARILERAAISFSKWSAGEITVKKTHRQILNSHQSELQTDGRISVSGKTKKEREVNRNDNLPYASTEIDF